MIYKEEEKKEANKRKRSDWFFSTLEFAHHVSIEVHFQELIFFNLRWETISFLLIFFFVQFYFSLHCSSSCCNIYSPYVNHRRMFSIDSLLLHSARILGQRQVSMSLVGQCFSSICIRYHSSFSIIFKFNFIQLRSLCKILSHPYSFLLGWLLILYNYLIVRKDNCRAIEMKLSGSLRNRSVKRFLVRFILHLRLVLSWQCSLPLV